jgi:hypothetical protein
MSDAAANPQVNRYLRDKAMDHIDHALGRPLWPLRESYRNYYAVDADSAAAIEFAYSAHWYCKGVQGGMAWFGVTERGRQALDMHLRRTSKVRGWLVKFHEFSRIVPAATAAKAKYAYFLDVSDCWSDLTFGDFARQCTVRRLA